MFGFFKKTDRYSELYDHLVSRWKMKPGFAAAFLNEYRNSLSKQYEKGLTFHRQAIMSQTSEYLEMIFISLRDSTLASQAYLAYMHDLRSGKYAGTNIEKAIWAILISQRSIVGTHNPHFVKYLLDNVDEMFPDLIFSVFNDPLGLFPTESYMPTINELNSHPESNELRVHSDAGYTHERPRPTLAKDLYGATQEKDNIPEHPLQEIQERIDKNSAHTIAVAHVCSTLKSKGYEIVFRGKSRGDTISIIANYENNPAYILVAASLHPKQPLIADFMKDRLIKCATDDGADYYVARVVLEFSMTANHDGNPETIDKNSIKYFYKGLEKK